MGDDAVWLISGGEPGAQRFGQLVQRLRKSKQMSVEELAEGALLSVGTIRAIEQARRAPSEESGLRLLRLLLPEGSFLAKEEAASGAGHARPDAAFVDPETGERVLLEFKAKTAGDNRRWSSDKPRPMETKAEAALREFLADPVRMQNWHEGMRPAWALLSSVVADVKSLAARPASDADIGRIMRRLATANKFQLEYVESLLDIWERAVSDNADDQTRDHARRVNAILNEVQPFPDESEIVELPALDLRGNAYRRVEARPQISEPAEELGHIVRKGDELG